MSSVRGEINKNRIAYFLQGIDIIKWEKVYPNLLFD